MIMIVSWSAKTTESIRAFQKMNLINGPLNKTEQPPFWGWLEVFQRSMGPNEYHKGRMARVMFIPITRSKKQGK
jgi:hypothetical protein